MSERDEIRQVERSTWLSMASCVVYAAVSFSDETELLRWVNVAGWSMVAVFALLGDRAFAYMSYFAKRSERDHPMSEQNLKEMSRREL